MMENFKFKKITTDNWLNPDDAWSYFVKISSVNGGIGPISAEDWITGILEPKLKDYVPENIQELFEIARYSMTYGFFFYPLITVAEEQLFRVVETAVTLKCKTIGAPKFVNKFHKRIDFLAHRNIIPEQEIENWHAIRQLRNIASHPDFQNISTPGEVIRILHRTSEEINFLFEKTE